MKDATTTTLANGITLCNFSSAHSFTFEDGSMLPACDPERCKALMLHSVEIEHPNPGGWTDIELRFELSDIVRNEVARLNAREDIDILIVPFPVMTALKTAGINVGKCRTTRMKDRVTKMAHDNRFCR